MTGAFQQLEKESFWKEHQDTLVKVRQELQSGKKSRYGTPGGVRKRTPNGKSGIQPSSHPPFGKYRRTPSPYLPKLSPEPLTKFAQQKGLGKKVLEVVPPLKPKKAFLTSSAEDYDSWGEESDDEDEYNYEHIKSMKRRRKAMPVKQQRRLKPQLYPTSMGAYVQPQVVYGLPFPVYYPPPPIKKGNKQREKYDRNTRKVHKNKSGIPVMKKRKSTNVHPPVPMLATFYPDMSGGVFGSVTDMEEGTEEEDLMTKSAFSHWKKHPLFASDFCTWFIDDCLNTELLPDLLIDTMNEIKYMPHDHPLYLPSLYTCEDILSDHVSEMVLDIVRETAGELANDYLDEKMLKRDPLEDFLTGIIEDVVQVGTREVVRSTVINLAEDYVENEYAMGVIQSLLKDYVREIGPDLLDEITFDLIAEDFIQTEVIAPEVQEESEVLARETIQYYDDKVLKRQLKEVSQQADDVLADSIIMEYLLSLMTQHGKLWAETDHQNKYLDDLILNTSLTQIFNIHKQRQKTVQCKPLQKLHEKVVSDVALDVFLQHLTRTLDEDMADIDEYEREATDDSCYPFPLAASVR